MPTIKTGIRFSKKQPLSEQELRQLHRPYWACRQLSDGLPAVSDG